MRASIRMFVVIFIRLNRYPRHHRVRKSTHLLLGLPSYCSYTTNLQKGKPYWLHPDGVGASTEVSRGGLNYNDKPFSNARFSQPRKA